MDNISKIENIIEEDRVLAVQIIQDVESLGEGVKRLEITRGNAKPVQADIARRQARDHSIYNHEDFARYLLENGKPAQTVILCDPFKSKAVASLNDRSDLDSETITYSAIPSADHRFLSEIKGRSLKPREFSRLCRRLALIAHTDGGAAELRLMAGQLSVSKEVTEATAAGTKGVHGRMVKVEAKAGAGESVVSVPDRIVVLIRPFLDSLTPVQVELFIDLVVGDSGVLFEIDIPSLTELAAAHFEQVIGALREALPGFYAGLGSHAQRNWRTVQ